MTSYEFEVAAKNAVIRLTKEKYGFEFDITQVQIVWFAHVLGNKKAILITIIGTSTLSSSMYSIYIAFGKKAGLAVNAALIAGWSILIPLGVMGMWTLMASVRIYFVGAGILFAICWNAYEKRKAVRA